MKARPLVIAHRGACGYLPEHTLAAYSLAIAQGADFIEPDLVATRDGVLVARHANELSASTDVAGRGAYADRRCRKRVDGVDIDGWFVEDFSLAEIRTLRAREPWPARRPESARADGLHGIPTFAEILALAASARRPVGVYPEIKHPTWFAHEGERLDGSRIATPLAPRLVDGLVAAGFTDPARLFLQSFEPSSLRELRDVWLPRAGLAAPLVQLLGEADGPPPRDVAWHRARGDDPGPRFGPGAPWRDDGVATTADIVSPAGLRWLRGFADALGPSSRDLLAAPTPPPWFDDARALGFLIHPYTVRAETGGAADARRLLALGVHGFFVDQPDLGVAVRDAYLVGSAGDV